jgi:5-methylcytosine-specific restriction protein A
MMGPSNHPAAAYPSWLGVIRCPFTVIAGPAGNGARAYIDARASDDDMVLDVAEIIAGLADCPAHRAKPEWIIPALERRNGALERLARGIDAPAAWLISQSPMLWQRDFWVQRGATIVLLDPGLEAAIVAARAEGVQERWVQRWYTDAKGRQAAPRGMPTTAPRESAAKRGYAGDQGGGVTHAQLRDKQFARQPWCEFCDQLGKRVRANVLDHRQPFRDAEGNFIGKLWGDPKNHRSLCTPCHDGRGATRSRAEKPPGAGVDGRPLDPAHPWSRK